jgi:hypothetical protein
MKVLNMNVSHHTAKRVEQSVQGIPIRRNGIVVQQPSIVVHIRPLGETEQPRADRCIHEVQASPQHAVRPPLAAHMMTPRNVNQGCPLSKRRRRR